MTEIGSQLPQAAAFGLYALAAEIMRKAQRLVPVDTGRLRASGYIVPPEKRGGRWSVIVGYGTEYALWVHEGTKHMEGRKWLEKAINAFSSRQGLAIVANVVERAAAGEFRSVPSANSEFNKGPNDGD